MSTAILTVDDVASANTPDIVDYLCKKNIRAVMFAEGQNAEKYYEEALYALKKGMIIGNHSYSHPHFSDISYAQCIEEIEKTEALLDRLYQEAGVPRLYRPFRFPYGDKGDDQNGSKEHYEAIQKYLRDHHFSKLVDTQITAKWYHESKKSQDIDTFWTFDFCEYRLHYDADFSVQSVYQRIDDENPAQGDAILKEGSSHIVLLHAHDETEAILPRYYEQFLEYCMAHGVRFIAPEFR